MRADARANRDRVLAAAADLLAERGTEVSMRDIARRADVGLATLLRNFPTREALLEALLEDSFEDLAARARAAAEQASPADALIEWLRHFVAFTTTYHGVVTSMVHAIDDPDSALHESCVLLKSEGARLLERAQAVDGVRADLDGADLFALVSALAWLGDQPEQQERSARLLHLVATSLLSESR